VPEDVRRESYEDEGSGGTSTTRVLVMLAILVSLVAVLGMLQVREKQREAVVLWPTGPFDAGVSVLSVVYHPVDATAVVTVDELGWRALSPENQSAITQRYAQISAPQGAKAIRVVGSSGLPLNATKGDTTLALPPPPVP
jgi:hypothetical protein